MKMEPIVSSETSAIRTQTSGNYPKRNNLHLEHGESLRTRLHKSVIYFVCQNTNVLAISRFQWLILADLDAKAFDVIVFTKYFFLISI